MTSIPGHYNDANTLHYPTNKHDCSVYHQKSSKLFWLCISLKIRELIGINGVENLSSAPPVVCSFGKYNIIYKHFKISNIVMYIRFISYKLYLVKNIQTMSFFTINKFHISKRACSICPSLNMTKQIKHNLFNTNKKLFFVCKIYILRL